MAYPFAPRLRHDARRIGHSVETRPEGGAAKAAIMDFVSRGIGNAYFAPKVELLARIGDGVRFRFRPVFQ